MAYFDVNPVSATGVVIAAAGTSTERARFIALGVSNVGTAQRVLLIYDGTAAAGTIRARFSLTAGAGFYYIIDQSGKSVLPKTWFTAGNAIECALDAAGDVRVFGEVVREA